MPEFFNVAVFNYCCQDIPSGCSEGNAPILFLMSLQQCFGGSWLKDETPVTVTSRFSTKSTAHPADDATQHSPLAFTNLAPGYRKPKTGRCPGGQIAKRFQIPFE